MKIKKFCYICRKTTLFTNRGDLHNNIGVKSHCSECVELWFEWQDKAVYREMAKWIEYNSNEFYSKRFVNFEM